MLFGFTSPSAMILTRRGSRGRGRGRGKDTSRLTTPSTIVIIGRSGRNTSRRTTPSTIIIVGRSRNRRRSCVPSTDIDIGSGGGKSTIIVSTGRSTSAPSIVPRLEVITIITARAKTIAKSTTSPSCSMKTLHSAQ